MNSDINQMQHDNKESRDVPIDLEFELHLFDLYVNDHIENQAQRLMECCSEQSLNQK